ncbi:hypothetical protein G6F59_017645 [Rhizopus arrhizus]|nr:hypothetical protein G6F59_017645 [Rhizopus arrhizus]
MRPGRGCITTTRSPRNTASSTSWFVLQPRTRQRVQGAQRFIQQQHRRILHQHPRKQRALHLTARERIHAASGGIRQPHRLQRIHATVKFFAAIPAPSADSAPRPHRHQVQHRHGERPVQFSRLRQPG